MDALVKITGFIKTNKEEEMLECVPFLFVLVKESTSSFKESNFNVAKAILQFFTTLFESVYMKLTKVPDSFLIAPAVKIAVEKMSDRKLSEASISCLDSLCVIKDPQKVMLLLIKNVSEIKSPLAHEAVLNWFKKFCTDFGAQLLPGSMQDVVAWILSVRFYIKFVS